MKRLFMKFLTIFSFVTLSFRVILFYRQQNVQLNQIEMAHFQVLNFNNASFLEDQQSYKMSDQLSNLQSQEINMINVDEQANLTGAAPKKQPVSLRGKDSQQQRDTRLAMKKHLSRNYYWIIAGFLLMVVLAMMIFVKSPQKKEIVVVNPPSLPPPPKVEGTRLPKILWLYTYNNHEGETAMNQIQLDYFKHLAVLNGYEARIVDSWTAYDWLSQPMISKITKTIQNTKMDVTVCDLLKLGLLMEHGGIMIGNLSIIMTSNSFSWLEKMFHNVDNDKSFKIDPKAAEIYVPVVQPTGEYNYYFRQNIIAAVPNSRLIVESFKMMSEMIVTGYLERNSIFGFFKPRLQASVNQVPYPIATVMTSLIHIFSQSSTLENPYRHYCIQSRKNNNMIDMKGITPFEAMRMLRDGNFPFNSIDLILNGESYLKGIVDSLLINNYKEPIEKGSIISNIFSSPKNMQILLKPLPKRQISLCLVYIDQLTPKQVKAASVVLKEQKYSKKQLVVFSKDEIKQDIANLTIVKSSNNQVRNIQIALTQHCKPKGYAIFMKAGDNFGKETDLQTIAKAVEDRSVLGANINIVVNNKLEKAEAEYPNFMRVRDAGNKEFMKKILNHMRIISVDAFRYLPQFQLRDAYGVYFKDRTVILSALLELLTPNDNIRTPDARHTYIYMKKKYDDLFHFPSLTVLIPSQTFIYSQQYEDANPEQLSKIQARSSVQPLEQSLLNCELHGVPLNKLLVFNNGTEYVSIDKKQGSDLIPKVIHQAWIGGQMPFANQYFLQKVKRLHPSYKIVLWTEDNITQKNFPVAYDIIKTLISYQKAGKAVTFNKFFTVKDILRHEVMYRQGGFWRDTGVNHFKSVFDQFRKYKMVIGAERTLTHRWKLGMCFFANEPHSEHMLRVNNYRNVNRMRYYDVDSVGIAGPIDFRQVLSGDQENNPGILVLHNQYYYPSNNGPNSGNDLCLKISEDKGPSPYEFEYKGYVLLPNCEMKYPEAFGLDHKSFEVSWRGQQ